MLYILFYVITIYVITLSITSFIKYYIYIEAIYNYKEAYTYLITFFVIKETKRNWMQSKKKF